jgi:hypothetical protein
VGEDFKEISHTGGQLIFNVVTDANGARSFDVTWTHCRPVMSALLTLWALPQGIPVAFLPMGGVGAPWPAPPVPGSVPVFMGSDSEGKFGMQCPNCNGYWRADAGASICSYCGAQSDGINILTEAQRNYVSQYCMRLRQALADHNDGEHIIDMDAVADAVGKESEKPPFYYAEESQQTKFTCEACGGFNDILGNFGYCSICGTRSDLAELTTRIIPKIRARINSTAEYENCVRDAASAFDSFASRYIKQLIANVPLSGSRRSRLENMRFHNLQKVRDEILSSFDIDIFTGLKKVDAASGVRMFCRRHVYEHNGGEADPKYILDSGDTGTRLGEALKETKESAHEFVSLISRLATNFHEGFHELFPPLEAPIKRHAERKGIMQRHN